MYVNNNDIIFFNKKNLIIIKNKKLKIYKKYVDSFKYKD